MVRYKSRLITTSRRRKVCFNISAPSRKQPNCRSFSTAFRGVAAWRSAWTRRSGWRAPAKILLGSKKPAEIRIASARLRAALGEKFIILSGDDSFTLPFMSVGAQGVISVASNVIPREVSQMVKLFAAGKTFCRAENPSKVLPDFQRFIHRDKPRPSKSSFGDDGTNCRGISFATGENEREEPRRVESNAQSVRGSQIIVGVQALACSGQVKSLNSNKKP